MFYLILFLIWFCPAAIAGMLGWSGIWGTGRAFFEFLIPLPVAGGVFHLPGLVLSIVVLKLLDQNNKVLNASISYAAFALFIAMLSLHIDFDRFYSWLTTDYKPSGLPIRFDSNAILLFSLCDSFWVWVYSLVRGARFNKLSCLIILCLPPIILVLQGTQRSLSGPEFKIGGSEAGEQRGQERQYIYTNIEYDEDTLREWLLARSVLASPWTNPNTEHEAIIFTSSLQLLEWRKFREINTNNVVATACAYEEDESVSIFKGVYDCFASRKTVHQRLTNIATANATGFDKSIDFWHARTMLCEDIELSGSRHRSDIAEQRLCINLNRYFEKDFSKFVQRYGEESAEMKFLRTRAKKAGLPKNIPQL